MWFCRCWILRSDDYKRSINSPPTRKSIIWCYIIHTVHFSSHMQQKSSIKQETHTHTQTNGSCWCGGQIKYLFPVSGECLDRAPLILVLWEPLVPWITLSLRAPRQTGSHAPFCSMPRHQPATSTPIFSDPPLHHSGRCAESERERGSEQGRERGEEQPRTNENAQTQQWNCSGSFMKTAQKAQNTSPDLTRAYFNHSVWSVYCHRAFLPSWNRTGSLAPIGPSGYSDSKETHHLLSRE